MKTYDKYKSSGIDWIGDIPEHWTHSKVGYISRIVRGASPRPAGDPELFDGDHTPWITVAEVTKDDTKFITGVSEYLTEEGAKRSRFVEIGILLLSNSGATLGVPKILKIGGCINDGSVAFLDLDKRVLIDFLYHFFITHTEIYREQAKGSGQPNLNTDIVKSTNFVFPSIEEQTAIADYLDEKTAQVDKLMAEKRRLIELLKEERLGVINQAVTRGINPHAKLKPSGIAWLGDIPEYWEVKRLKYLVSKVGSGITPSGGANVYLEEGIPLLRSQNIYNEGLVLEDVAFISEEIDKQMSNSRIKDNDVLLNITGASIGRCCYIPKDFGRGNVNQHVCIIRPIPSAIETKYLHAFLISGFGQNLVDSCQTGANREGLNFQQIKSFEIPVCDVSEQKQIVEFIETATGKIDATIAKIEKEIGFLREYRTALISEVVTGKIKVV